MSRITIQGRPGDCWCHPAGQASGQRVPGSRPRASDGKVTREVRTPIRRFMPSGSGTSSAGRAEGAARRFYAHAADRVVLDCNGAGTLVRHAWRTGCHPGGKAERGSRQRAGGGTRPGTVRMPPVSSICIPVGPRRSGPASRMAGTPTACPKTSGSPGPWDGHWSGSSSGAGLRQTAGPGKRRSGVAAAVPGHRGAGGFGCPEPPRPVPPSH